MVDPGNPESTSADSFFSRFTPRAKGALHLARRHTERLNHAYVGDEHLLLGLLDLPPGPVLWILEAVGRRPEHLREVVERGTVPELYRKTPRFLPFTAHVRRVLELALGEAERLGHEGIGEEHLLLGLAWLGQAGVAVQELPATSLPAEPEHVGAAARTLVQLGCTPKALRRLVIELHSDEN